MLGRAGVCQMRLELDPKTESSLEVQSRNLSLFWLVRRRFPYSKNCEQTDYPHKQPAQHERAARDAEENSRRRVYERAVRGVVAMTKLGPLVEVRRACHAERRPFAANSRGPYASSIHKFPAA
jgi:hypothetical protein